MNALYASRGKHIHWPRNPERNCAEFQRLWGFPNVVGAIDGTHINVPSYKGSQGYINRKGRASIQLQVVCDHRTKFIHCYTGQVGSVHDQRVFRLSGVQEMCNDIQFFPNNSHLIGDNAYINQAHLLTRYKNNGHLTPGQDLFNESTTKARLVVERSIGLLKGRWRRVLRKLPMLRVDLVPY